MMISYCHVGQSPLICLTFTENGPHPFTSVIGYEDTYVPLKGVQYDGAALAVVRVVMEVHVALGGEVHG